MDIYDHMHRKGHTCQIKYRCKNQVIYNVEQIVQINLARGKYFLCQLKILLFKFESYFRNCFIIYLVFLLLSHKKGNAAFNFSFEKICVSVRRGFTVQK